MKVLNSYRESLNSNMDNFRLKKDLLLYLVDNTFSFGINKDRFYGCIPKENIQEYCRILHCSKNEFKKIKSELKKEKLIIEKNEGDKLRIFFIPWWKINESHYSSKALKRKKYMLKELEMLLNYKRDALDKPDERDTEIRSYINIEKEKVLNNFKGEQ